MLTSYIKPRPTVWLFYVIFTFTLRVMTPPPIFHPKTELHRSSHPIVLPRSGLISPGQTSFYPTGLHCLSATCCLASLDLLTRSLLSLAPPRHDTVSSVLSPVRSPPFTRRCQPPCQPPSSSLLKPSISLLYFHS